MEGSARFGVARENDWILRACFCYIALNETARASRLRRSWRNQGPHFKPGRIPGRPIATGSRRTSASASLFLPGSLRRARWLLERPTMPQLTGTASSAADDLPSSTGTLVRRRFRLLTAPPRALRLSPLLAAASPAAATAGTLSTAAVSVSSTSSSPSKIHAARISSSVRGGWYPGSDESSGASDRVMEIPGKASAASVLARLICVFWCKPRSLRFVISATETALLTAAPSAIRVTGMRCTHSKSRVHMRREQARRHVCVHEPAVCRGRQQRSCKSCRRS